MITIILSAIAIITYPIWIPIAFLFEYIHNKIKRSRIKKLTMDSVSNIDDLHSFIDMNYAGIDIQFFYSRERDRYFIREDHSLFGNSKISDFDNFEDMKKHIMNTPAFFAMNRDKKLDNILNDI